MKTLRGIFVLAAALLGLYAVGCGGDDDNNPVNPGPGTADVTIQILGQNGANSYSPSPDTVTVGQTVSWHNADATPHTATSDVGSAIGTGNIAAGATSAPKAMNNPGSFSYHCTIHPTMTGILVVQ